MTKERQALDQHVEICEECAGPNDGCDEGHALEHAAIESEKGGAGGAVSVKADVAGMAAKVKALYTMSYAQCVPFLHAEVALMVAGAEKHHSPETPFCDAISEAMGRLCARYRAPLVFRAVVPREWFIGIKQEQSGANSWFDGGYQGVQEYVSVQGCRVYPHGNPDGCSFAYMEASAGGTLVQTMAMVTPKAKAKGVTLPAAPIASFATTGPINGLATASHKIEQAAQHFPYMYIEGSDKYRADKLPFKWATASDHDRKMACGCGVCVAMRSPLFELP